MTTPRLITFGRGSTTYHWRSCDRMRDKPRTVQSPDDPHELPDGIPAIDMRAAAKTKAGMHAAVAGPMINVDLEPDTVDHCPDMTGSTMVQAMRSEAGNQFGQLATLHQTLHAQAGPLDFVPVGAYIDLWRNAGALIGVTSASGFTWDDQPLSRAAMRRLADDMQFKLSFDRTP